MDNFNVNAELRGCLKAAEAKDRLREYKHLIDKRKEDNIRELVNFQPTALQAIRLELLMKPLVVKQSCLPYSKTEAERLEQLLADKKTWLPS